MAKYTTEVRTICEMAAGGERKGQTDVDAVLEIAADNVLPYYPLFSSEYRHGLNKKILEHFYTREIGFETVGLWKLKMGTKLREIMPYYNKLYETETLKFNPFWDVDLTTSRAGSRSEKSDKTGSENDKENRTVSSENSRNRTSAKTGTINTSGEDHEDRTDNRHETGSETVTGNDSSTRTGARNLTGQSNDSNRRETASESGSKSTAATNTVADSNSNNQSNTINNSQSTGTNKTTTESDSNSNAFTNDDNWQLFSDTPQGGLSAMASAPMGTSTGVGDYLTTAQRNYGNSNSSSIANDSTKTDSLNTASQSGTTKSEDMGTEHSVSGSVSNGTQSETGNVVETGSGANSRTEHEMTDGTQTDSHTQDKEKEGDISTSGDIDRTRNEETETTGNETEDENINRLEASNRAGERTTAESGSVYGTDEWIQRVSGKQGGASYSKLLEEFRGTLLNIDMEIIKRLEPLFMQVW